MAFAAGGELAAAITHAGGLGLIGGAYGDADWLETEFTAAGNAEVGCGFITWSLDDKRELLAKTLERRPKAIMLSFADPEPYARQIHDNNTPLICQVQTKKHAERAIECGAHIIVAQGSEAGGHGAKRATLTLIPEIADLIVRKAPETLLCAAGGIGDGRGIAAALMLGADGVLIGSRFWASNEAKVAKAMLEASIAASGDDTIRSSVMDVARRLNWPDGYTCRVLKNPFTERWHEDMDNLIANADQEAAKWREAWQQGDPEGSNTFVGEVTGLIEQVEPAGDLLQSMIQDAEQLLGDTRRYIR